MEVKDTKFDLLMQTYVRNINSLWQPDDKDKVDFFHLANLWEQYDEWSAYGVSVPFRLKTGEPVTQYYTPYLSAIQIYTTENLVASRSLIEPILHNGSM